MKSIGSALIAVCLLAMQAQAADQHWVAVGSFDSESVAQATAQRLGLDIADPLSVHGSQTGLGYRYRVLAGPYADRTAATVAVERARAAGVLDAWVFADRDGSVQPGSVALPAYDASTDADASLYGENYEYEPLPETETYPTWQQQSEANSEADRKLVEEPPPGYRLHRLLRDG